MEFTLSLDDKKIKKNLEEKLITDSESIIKQSINTFFENTTQHYRDSSGQLQFKETKGPGRIAIEEMTENRFLEESFEKDMNVFFEGNWKRIFEDCMTKALQHKANAIAFAKTKELE